MEEEIYNYNEDSFGDTVPLDIEMSSNMGGDMSFDEYSSFFGRKARARRQARRMERIRNRQERRKLRRQGRMEAMRDRQAIRTERRRLRAERRKIKMDDEEAPSEEAPSEESSSDAPVEEAPTEAPEESVVDQETGQSDAEADYTGDAGFDGTRQPTAEESSLDNYYSADGGAMIPMGIKERARRIEKTKTKIGDLMAQYEKQKMRAGETIDKGENRLLRYLMGQIKMYQTRLAKLEADLAGVSKADGDYEEFVGMGRGAERRAMVRMAKKQARNERRMAYRARRRARVAQLFAQYKGEGLVPKLAMAKARQQAFTEMPPVTGAQLDAMGTTTVDANLNPSMADNLIKVPASSSMDGTGLIGMDEMADWDAPDVRNIELDFSNAEGSSKKKTWMWVGIGVGVAVLGIIAYKMMRKK